MKSQRLKLRRQLLLFNKHPLPLTLVLSKRAHSRRKSQVIKQVDLSNVQGTGPGGRIVRKDIEAALSSRTTHSIKQQASLRAWSAHRFAR